MEKKEYIGYITFVKENNTTKENEKEFIENYTKNNINIGDKLHSDKLFVITNRLEESFHALSSLGLQEFDNLIFAKVKSDDYSPLERFYYLKDAAITNNIEVIDILTKSNVLSLIKSDISARYIEGIQKYLQFIKFDENDKDFIRDNATNGFKSKIKTAISCYQDGDKDAYKKYYDSFKVKFK